MKSFLRLEKKNRMRGTIEKVMESIIKIGGYKKRKIKSLELIEKYEFNSYVFELLIVRWFVVNFFLMAIIESKKMRVIFLYINKNTTLWIPIFSNTVKDWILRVYE